MFDFVIMQGEERKRVILEKVNTHEFVDVETLSSMFDVSSMTIRRDLNELERMGLLQRTHGGAVKPDYFPGYLYNFDTRVNYNRTKKVELCTKAAKFIRENDILFIDCGTTMFFLCEHLQKFKNLRIITNSLPIVSELTKNRNIKISLIGGELDSERKAMYGPMAERSISEYHATKAFIGADGVSLEGGLSSNNEKESMITKRMAEHADEVILLCDSSKIEKNAFVKFAPIRIIHTLITNSDLEPDLQAKYRAGDFQCVF